MLFYLLAKFSSYLDLSVLYLEYLLKDPIPCHVDIGELQFKGELDLANAVSYKVDIFLLLEFKI